MRIILITLLFLSCTKKLHVKRDPIPMGLSTRDSIDIVKGYEDLDKMLNLTNKKR